MKDDTSTISAVAINCTTCAHRNPTNPVVCEAFPKGIPMLIMVGAWDHNVSFNIEGVSDNGVIYEPTQNPLDNPAA